jgi:hypothetical protein
MAPKACTPHTKNAKNNALNLKNYKFLTKSTYFTLELTSRLVKNVKTTRLFDYLFKAAKSSSYL